MIYFENHEKGNAGLNNHVVSYTFCVAISNFLERDFYFDHETPSTTPPDVRIEGHLKKQLQYVHDSRRSLVSELLDIPSRRVYEIDRHQPTKRRIGDPMLMFMTDRAQQEKFGSTMIWNFFSLGRTALVKEELEGFDLVEFAPRCIINASFFFFLEREAKRRLLDSIRIRYREDLERLAEKFILSRGRFNAIHLRLGDFVSAYGPDGYRVDPDGFGKFLRAVAREPDLPLLIATDQFQNKDLFATMLDGFRYEFIDEVILGEFFDEFSALSFSDFNILSVLSQLICAGAVDFAGTCRSTFTSVIHRIRQERYGKTEVNLFPDARVVRHLDSQFRTVPDGQGFFEWNRYSAFAEHYEYPAWMREWNYDLTAV